MVASNVSGGERGTFNLNRFKAEVQSRLAFARESTNAEWRELQSSTYMKDYVLPKSDTRSGSKIPKIMKDIKTSFDVDAAYSKIQKVSNEIKAHDKSGSIWGSRREDERGRSHSSSEGVQILPARSFGHLDIDISHPDRMKWIHPEKWYSLTEYSAQHDSIVRAHREQTERPLPATKPSESSYSLPPARINRFADVSANPRLIDGTSKRRIKSSTNVVAPVRTSLSTTSLGLMRKCHDPFNEGWKVKTFKPAREKLVPYQATVVKYVKDRGFGYLECQGQEVFVHQDDVHVPDGLKPGQAVYFEFAGQGRHGLQARNVRLAAGSQIKPPGMELEECEDHLTRRKHEEFVRSLFQTGFWKYPTTGETLPKEFGGGGLNFHPFVQDEKFGHRTASKSGEIPEGSFTCELVDNGPDLNVKVLRKPWLRDGKLMPYLIKSPSRHPLQRPSCNSYYTSPIVSSLDLPLEIKREHSKMSVSSGLQD